MRPAYGIVRRCAVGLLIVALLFLGALGVSAAPPRPITQESSGTLAGVPPAGRGKVKVLLNLREGPYADTRVVLSLRPGEQVFVTAGPVHEEDVDWVYVSLERAGRHYEGFCAARYLEIEAGVTPTQAPSAPAKTPSPQRTPGQERLVRVKAYGGLRLRSGPGLGYAVEYIAPNNSQLVATGVVTEVDGRAWAEVLVGGRHLWGAADYLEQVEP